MKKIESFKRLIILQLSLVGMLLQVGIYAYAWFLAYYPLVLRGYQRDVGIKLYFKGHVLILLVYFLLLFFFSQTYGGMKIGYLKAGDVIFSQCFSTVCVNVISYMQISLMYGWIVPALPMAYITLADMALAAVWTAGCSVLYLRVFPPRKLLLVYGERSIDDITEKFLSRPDKYRLEKFISFKEGIEHVKEEALGGQYDALVLWDIPADVRNILLKFCYGSSMRVYVMPKISDIMLRGAQQLHLFDTPILFLREYVLTFEQRFVKRFIDIVCSVILFVLASPVMLITAAAVRLYDGGPVLYKQVRCTRDKKEFYILKFRSMRVDAEKDGVARLASKNDSRITPVGKFIRMVRIDELPQLINILKGDMSFIGPRPERPEIIAQYMEEMPEFAYRMKVKAGLAGYAQVYGKYNTTPYDKLKLDLFYIENYSVWLDIKLMMLTLKILLKPESTEGVEESQTTAQKTAERNEDGAKGLDAGER